ncbi:YhjD/YihY/BrkB family envelope integrity protein [Galenea microaerophila]
MFCLNALRKRTFWLEVVKDFWAKRGMDSAAILAYTSLIALVPAVALALSLLSVSPWFDQVRQLIMKALVHHLLPSSKPIIEQYFVQFAQQAAHLNGLGSVSLLVMTLILLWTIDERINLIWGSTQHRKWGKALVHYVSVAIIGPLLLGISWALSSYLSALPLIEQGLGFVPIQHFGSFFTTQLLPLIFSLVGFAFLYRYVPIQTVHWSAAWVGAILATVEIEGVKYGFKAYLHWFPTYDLIYGAFAAIPIFLLWLYLIWWIVIFNGHVVYQLMQRLHGERAS